MESEIQVVGVPNGAEILYIEGYAYSFIKAALWEKKYKSMEVIMLGSETTENQKHNYFVSGVMFEEKEKEYFKEETELGKATITFSQKEYPEIQFRTEKNSVVKFEDYYIYYTDNENMKNYILSFAAVPTDKESKEEMYQMAIKTTNPILFRGVGELLKYIVALFIMAYIIIYMNHYRKLELVGEQTIYVIKTILQEDTFYTP